MEKELIIPLIFFIMIAIIGISLLVFYLLKNDPGYDYDKLIKFMNEQTDENLDILSKYNKEKNEIEKKIRSKKKQLGMDLANKKK